MSISTTRFGVVDYLERDVLEFSNGLIGMEECRQWVLLADAKNKSLGWLQSVERGDLALPVVSPRRFVPNYQVRVSSRDVATLGIETAKQAQILVVVSKTAEGMTLNLKAPIVVCLENRTGRQIIAKDDHAVQYLLGATVPFRRSA
ncbi:MAG: flagellar assembly protein FliW [Planctomycetota bacterium]